MTKKLFSESLVHNIVESKTFSRQFPLIQGQIVKTKIKFNSVESYLRLVNDARNMPDGLQSDHCLSEIFNECEISKMCKKIENVEDNSFGYSQTHK